MLLIPAAAASRTVTAFGTCPENVSPDFVTSSATARNASRGVVSWTLMKSTPRRFRSLTASRACWASATRRRQRSLRTKHVEDRSGRDDLGSEYLAAVVAVPEREDVVGVRPHVASADDTVRQIQIQRLHAGHLLMRVHVPEAGNQEPARPIHAQGIARDGGVSADRGDLATVDQHGHPRQGWTAEHVQDRDIRDRHGIAGCARGTLPRRRLYRRSAGGGEQTQQYETDRPNRH